MSDRTAFTVSAGPARPRPAELAARIDAPMRRVLMVSPHFPPDTSAASHRVRLLAPHLPAFGWEPTVVAVDPRDCETRLDPDLAALVPATLRVVRARAWSARITRRFGVGDLGLRAFAGLRRTCLALLERERFDALYITIYPSYPALLGPVAKRRFGVSFVLDYQDPWVGAWGRIVGAGPGGRPDWKSRLSRLVATRLEPRAVRAADAITAVSRRTWEDVDRRHPELASTPRLTLPIGGEPRDFDGADGRRAPFSPDDGNVHVCHVGTLLPLGLETLGALLAAVRRLRERRPDLYARLRLHFFGTSNQTTAGALPRALGAAAELGVLDRVEEIAPRLDYLDALAVLRRASANLLMGSSEPHYTASRIYPALWSGRPLLALYHEASSSAEILRRAGVPPRVRLVTYGDRERAASRIDAIAAELIALVEEPVADSAAFDAQVLGECSARALAGRLGALFDQVCRRP